ncbi:MAG: TolC family protein [Candidatus Binatia bacterium]
MQVRDTLLTTVGLLLAIPVVAQQPPGSPAEATAPPPNSVQLLDEVPNYAAALIHQLSGSLGSDVIAAEQSTEHYGLLGDEGPVRFLTLQEAIGLALQNNTDLQIQRLGPVSAGSEVRRARAVFDPVFFGSVSRDRQTTPATTPLTATIAQTGLQTLFTQNLSSSAGLRKTLLSGGQLSLEWTSNRLLTNPSIANVLVPRYTTTANISLNQPLLRDFGWRYSLLLVEVAQNTQQEAYHQYRGEIANIVSQVERAYWDLVLAIENVRVQEQGLALAKEVQRQNEGKFKVGALPRTAVLEAKSEVARRDANLIQARNQRDVARDNLRAVINYRQRGASSLALIEPRDKPTAVAYQIDLKGSLRSALERRPELIAARLDVHGKGLQRKAAENQLLPRVNFVGSIGVNGLAGSTPQITFGDPNNPIQASPGLKGDLGRALNLLVDGRFYNFSAAAEIEIPIGNAQAKAAYANANVDLEQSRLSLRKLEEGVTLEVKTAVSNLRTDLQSIEATRIARELAEENVRNQQARYDVGLATTKDLLDFQDKLTQARFAEVQALTQYNTDLAELHRVDGTLLSARNILIERVSPERAPWWAHF